MLQEWSDDKLRWEPEEYGGVEEIYVPSEIIWLPDIILYNKSDRFLEAEHLCDRPLPSLRTFVLYDKLVKFYNLRRPL